MVKSTEIVRFPFGLFVTAVDLVERTVRKNSFLFKRLSIMAHNFVEQKSGSVLCPWCGDRKGVDAERDCPRSQFTGKTMLSTF